MDNCVLSVGHILKCDPITLKICNYLLITNKYKLKPIKHVTYSKKPFKNDVIYSFYVYLVNRKIVNKTTKVTFKAQF